MTRCCRYMTLLIVIQRFLRKETNDLFWRNFENDITLSFDGSISEMLLWCDADRCQEKYDSLSESYSLSTGELICLGGRFFELSRGCLPITGVVTGDSIFESRKPRLKPAIFESSILKLIAARPILFIHLAISSRDEQQKYSQSWLFSSPIPNALDKQRKQNVFSCDFLSSQQNFTICAVQVQVIHFFLEVEVQFLDFYPRYIDQIRQTNSKSQIHTSCDLNIYNVPPFKTHQ